MYRGTGIGEFEVAGFFGAAAVADVGDEHWRERGGALCEAGGFCVRFSLLATARDGDGGAVHVHLSIADLVEPRPRERVVTGCDAFGDRKLKLTGSVAVWILGKISSDARWATAFDRVDDLPLAVLARLLVGGEGNLAGASAVDSATCEAQSLIRPDRHDVFGAVELVGGISSLLAREVGTPSV